jgi:4-diphosphocytidyl-2-C-methyl-D-erythritol kinase
MTSLVVTAPAKVNLFLGVGPLRPDGYHSVMTVMHTVELADTVTLTPADSLTLTCDTDLGIPAEHNLAYTAAKVFSEVFGVDVLLDIRVEKRIPSGAGLGGGSSDAAAVLAGLAYWADLLLDDERLLRVARTVGADCPFLLHGGAAVMRGRGDERQRTLPAGEWPVAIVKPPTPVPTAEAYRAFDASPLPTGDIRPVTDALCFRDPTALAEGLANNLTPAATSLVPDVADALAWVRQSRGVLGAEMSGSGSAVFAICADTASADAIASEAPDRGWWGASTALRRTGVTVSEEEGS